MKKNILIIIGLIFISALAYALNNNPRFSEITTFYSGHTHNGSETIGAPAHSGGTDRYGCHNRSVPYHCH